MLEKRDVLWVTLAMVMMAITVNATPLSICDIQYTIDISGDSGYNGQTIDCAGGIVINKWQGSKTKLTIYDPANPDGWGGIIAKTWGSEFDNVQVGDEVSFTSVLVEESSGNTQLTYDAATSAITVGSSNNPLPVGVSVTEAVFSEKYESMKVKVSDVEVTAMDLGRYGDNYNLHNLNGDYWAADYMNIDAGGPYHSYVTTGATFESVSGIIEHKISSSWDYYQVLTTATSDFVVPEPTTLTLLMAAGLIQLKKRNNLSRRS